MQYDQHIYTHTKKKSKFSAEFDYALCIVCITLLYRLIYCVELIVDDNNLSTKLLLFYKNFSLTSSGKWAIYREKLQAEAKNSNFGNSESALFRWILLAWL